MRGANRVRGEVGVTLGGREMLLRPTFGALVAAEGEVGSLFRLLDRAGRGEVQLGEIAALMWHCRSEEAGRCAPGDGEGRAAFEGLLMAEGLLKLLDPYRALLAAVFDAGD